MDPMKMRWVLAVLLGVRVAASWASEAEVKDLMKAVLGKEIIAADPRQQIDYWAEFGETNLTDGSRVEYVSIQNGDEVANRSSSMATAYYKGKMVTNVTPLADFCFGMRKTGTDGKVKVVRIDYQPPCWEARTKRDLPVDKVGDDVHVNVRYSCVVISNGFSRTVEVSDMFSLKNMQRVNRQELKELQYDLHKGEVRIYEGGVCVQTQVMEQADDEVRVVAKGFVKDEQGRPVAGQTVKLNWLYIVSNYRTLVNKATPHSKELVTDSSGYFEHGIRESSACEIRIERPGYIPLRFVREQSESQPPLPPLDIRLTPMPVGATNLGDRVSWGLEKDRTEIKSLKECRSIGLSLDTYKEDRTVYVKGWTTNREQADIWFELGGTDAEFAEHYDRCLSTNVSLVDWREWPLRIVGLRGAQIKEAPSKPSPGMSRDMQWTLCEADADGYSNELLGYAWEESLEEWKWGTKHQFSPNFYVRKDNKYGRLVELEVGPSPERGEWSVTAGIRPVTNMTLVARFNYLNMQTTNLGHRVLQRY